MIRLDVLFYLNFEEIKTRSIVLLFWRDDTDNITVDSKKFLLMILHEEIYYTHFILQCLKGTLNLPSYMNHAALKLFFIYF